MNEPEKLYSDMLSDKIESAYAAVDLALDVAGHIESATRDELRDIRGRLAALMEPPVIGQDEG